MKTLIAIISQFILRYTTSLKLLRENISLLKHLEYSIKNKLLMIMWHVTSMCVYCQAPQLVVKRRGKDRLINDVSQRH